MARGSRSAYSYTEKDYIGRLGTEGKTMYRLTQLYRRFDSLIAKVEERGREMRGRCRRKTHT